MGISLTGRRRTGREPRAEMYLQMEEFVSDKYAFGSVAPGETGDGD